ncbi:MAG: hypothetical protein NVSMB47_14830 [Polyangiales bacterium]
MRRATSALAGTVGALVLASCLLSGVDELTGGAPRVDAEGADAPREAATDSGADGGGTSDAEAGLDAEADAGAACRPLTGGQPCMDLFPFPSPLTEVIDGDGREFCTIPALEFDVGKGEGPMPPDAGPLIHSSVTLRAGWSSYGLHVHAIVHQASVDPGATLFSGDGVEILAKAGIDLTGTDPSAAHFIIQPPSPASGVPSARAGFYPVRSATSPSHVDERWFAARQTADGYEVEFRAPWDFGIGASAPEAGVIAFDFGVNVAYDAGAESGPGRFQSFIRVNPINPTSCYTAPDAFIDALGAPFCDDRTWCAPKLDP